ncbi:DJ-1/PfpI family protein [Nocardia sp. NPDC049149]|uniref:DJ-1/PfpI family protein n=1 Tax=Nocardia sp. NPDC049149 TaxID=3364315 RepID=UPI00371D92EC
MQIAIVLYPGMTALDVIGPYEVLRLVPGVHIRFVWNEPGPITTDSGVLLLAATHSFEETPSPDIVLIGGSGPATATAAEDAGLADWLRRVHKTTLWTTSVCTGSVILARAGLLAGKSATSHWAGLPALSALGVTPRPDDRIVREGKIVTAAGVSAGIDLGLWLTAQIANRETAEAIQLLIEYDPQPPFDSGHMSKASASVRRKAAAVVARETADLLVAEPRTVLREGIAIPRLLWDGALARARSRRHLGSRKRPVQR